MLVMLLLDIFTWIFGKSFQNMCTLNFWLNFSSFPLKLTMVSRDSFHHQGMGKRIQDWSHSFIKDTACLWLARLAGVSITSMFVSSDVFDVFDASGQTGLAVFVTWYRHLSKHVPEEKEKLPSV